MIRHSLLKQADLDKVAVYEDDKHVTYRELSWQAMEILRLLPGKSGENIAIFLPNGASYLAALYGVFMGGMAALTLNTKLTVYEVAPLLIQADVQAVITEEAYRPLFEAIAADTPIPVFYTEELLASSTGACITLQTVSEDAPMVLLTTSGTTGNAKIVQLTEKNVTTSTLAYLQKMDFEKPFAYEIRFVLGTPYCSVYGLMVLTACMIRGFPIVVLKPDFTLDSLYKAAEVHRATHFEGGVSVGLLMAQLSQRPIRYDIRSLRYLGLAGSPISAAVLQKLMQAYPGVEFWSGYGMTEAGPLIAKPDKKVNPDKLRSVGTKADGITLLIEAEGVRTNAPYTTGEIIVKGASIMPGYYKKDSETKKIMRDGFLYTGDIGYLDADGYLYICGRKKNIILVRGFNVHAEEIEACLLDSGLVKDCMVYGSTDAAGNEILCTDVIPQSPLLQTDAIHLFCRAHLASFKRPQKINLVDSIHKTFTGKTERA